MLGSVTKIGMDRAVATLRRNAAIIKKIVNTGVIDREKVYRLNLAYANMHIALRKINYKIEHWNDVIEE